jgi:hypothetical protein
MTMDNINLIKNLFSSLFLLMGIYRRGFTKICSFLYLLFPRDCKLASPGNDDVVVVPVSEPAKKVCI